MNESLIKKLSTIARSGSSYVARLIYCIFRPLTILALGNVRTDNRDISQRLSAVRYGILALMIIFALVSTTLIIQSSGIETLKLSTLDTNISLATTFSIYSLVNLVAVYTVYDGKIRNAIFTSILFIFASLGFLYLSSPKTYVILFVAIYGMGSYVTDRIDFENPYPAEHIINNLKTTEGVITYGLGLSILAIIGIISTTNYNPYLTEETYQIIIVLTSALSYAIPEIQRDFYSNLYKHRRINTPSHFWILSSKLGVLISASFAILDENIALITAAGILTPAIVSVLFFIYNRTQKTDTIMGTTYRDASELSDPLYVNANKDVDIGTYVGEDEADIEMSLNISIPKNLPDSRIAWQEFLKSTDRIHKLISEMSNADNKGDVRSRLDEFEEFYNDVAYKYYLHSLENNNRIAVEGWSDEPITRVRSQMYRCDRINLQDIYDLDIRIREKDDQQAYANLKNED